MTTSLNRRTTLHLILTASLIANFACVDQGGDSTGASGTPSEDDKIFYSIGMMAGMGISEFELTEEEFAADCGIKTPLAAFRPGDPMLLARLLAVTCAVLALGAPFVLADVPGDPDRSRESVQRLEQRAATSCVGGMAGIYLRRFSGRRILGI